MKKKMRWLLVGCLTAAVLAAATFAWHKSSAQTWPAFPETHETPVAVSDVLPDFGWRTGDIIPLTVFIKEVPGTVCDLKSVVIKGDAQLRSLKSYEEKQADGTRLIRLQLEVQAFVLKQPVWEVTPYITYRTGEKQERKTLELPMFEIGSSNTYDKRKITIVLPNGEKSEAKDGHPKDQPKVNLTSYAWLEDIGLGTVSLMLVVCAIWVISTRKHGSKTVGDKPLELFSNEWAETVADVKAAVRLLQNGNTDKQTYVRVQKGLLRLYRLDSVPLPSIEAAADGPCMQLMSLMHIIGFCHEVIYGKCDFLSGADVDKIVELLPEALAVAPHFRGIPSQLEPALAFPQS